MWISNGIFKKALVGLNFNKSPLKTGKGGVRVEIKRFFIVFLIALVALSIFGKISIAEEKEKVPGPAGGRLASVLLI